MKKIKSIFNHSMRILKFSLMSMGTEYFYMRVYSHDQTRDEELVLKLNKNKTS